MKTRRDALAVLGLAVGTPAALAADFSNQMEGSSGFSFGVAGSAVVFGSSASRKKMSDALRRLADDVDAGGTLIQEMTLTSKVRQEDFLMHSLQIEFALLDDVQAARTKGS